jgi:hypothetical protein
VASFFISHSSRDNALADRVRIWLQQHGFTSLFLDFDPEAGIPPGRHWEDEVYSELRKADVVVFLATAAALDSKWCHSELVLARSLGRTILPLQLEPEAQHPLIGDTQWVRLQADGVPVSLDPLSQALRRLGIDRLDTLEWDPRLPPYPGLVAFDEDRAGVFFGRTEEIAAVLDRLVIRNTQARERFVVVSGPSGSGKSSLVRAGVLPRLRLQERPWIVIPAFRPGDRPLRHLAQALCSQLQGLGREQDWRECRERLAAGRRALADIMEDILVAANAVDGGRVVLVVDQAEEVATQAARQERVAVLDLISVALEQVSELRAVATVRSEYLDELVRGSAFEGHALTVITVGRLGPERLVDVITRPAERAGIAFEAGLVARMVEETSGDVPAGGDALPLLAFALRKAYDVRSKSPLVTWADYERTGGVVGALNGAADRVYDELKQQGSGELVIPTLLELVHVESERPPSSRSVARSHFDDDAWRVVEAFVEARLLTTEGPEPVVHVAHDALLREWPLLARAIENFEDELLTRSRLGRDAREWHLAGREPSYLLAGKRLDAAVAAVESPRWMEDPLVDEFVDASRRRAKRDAWRSRLLVGLAALVAIGLAGLAAWYGVDRARESLHKSAARSDQISLGAFRIDDHEVTDVQYGLCVDEGRCRPPGNAGSALGPAVSAGTRPVVMVDQGQAAHFCTWIGRRLPTAAEGARAARSGRLRRLLRGGKEWTATSHGLAFKTVYRDPDTGIVQLIDVSRAFRDLDITFRCAV